MSLIRVYSDYKYVNGIRRPVLRFLLFVLFCLFMEISCLRSKSLKGLGGPSHLLFSVTRLIPLEIDMNTVNEC